jgi:hypothetical protein
VARAIVHRTHGTPAAGLEWSLALVVTVTLAAGFTSALARPRAAAELTASDVVPVASVAQVSERDRRVRALAAGVVRRLRARAGPAALPAAVPNAPATLSANAEASRIASVTVRNDRDTLWVGDTATMTLSARNAMGMPLAEPLALWSPDDPSIAVLVAPGQLAARSPGITIVRARAFDGARFLTDSTSIVVLPRLAGVVVAAGSESGVQARVRFASIAGQAMTETDARGRFDAPLRIQAREGAVCILPIGADSAAYRLATLPVATPGFRDVRVALLPKRWHIVDGSMRGTDVEIKLAAAMSRWESEPGFWRVSTRTAGAHLVAWTPDSLPIPVVFRRGGRSPISPADSVAFWELARGLERIVGRALFTPATAGPTIDGRDRIVVEVDEGLRQAGSTFITYGQTGRIIDALVTVQRRALLGDSRVVMHELLHALGAGHTRAWLSIMNTAGLGPSLPTAEDVAYLQVLYRLRALHDTQGAIVATGATGADCNP